MLTACYANLKRSVGRTVSFKNVCSAFSPAFTVYEGHTFIDRVLRRMPPLNWDTALINLFVMDASPGLTEDGGPEEQEDPESKEGGTRPGGSKQAASHPTLKVKDCSSEEEDRHIIMWIIMFIIIIIILVLLITSGHRSNSGHSRKKRDICCSSTGSR